MDTQIRKYLNMKYTPQNKCSICWKFHPQKNVHQKIKEKFRGKIEEERKGPLQRKDWTEPIAVGENDKVVGIADKRIFMYYKGAPLGHILVRNLLKAAIIEMDETIFPNILRAAFPY